MYLACGNNEFWSRVQTAMSIKQPWFRCWMLRDNRKQGPTSGVDKQTLWPSSFRRSSLVYEKAESLKVNFTVPAVEVVVCH